MRGSKRAGTLRCLILWLHEFETEQSENESDRTMKMSGYPFGTVDWSNVERVEYAGETGVAYWRTRDFGDIRVRRVEYTPGYLADHWCEKGHILLCLEGELHTQLKDGRTFVPSCYGPA